MTDIRALLRRTADIASDFLESLDDRPVFPRTSAAELRRPALMSDALAVDRQR